VNVLITGGCGFIGSHLCELLLNEGHRVVVLDNLYSGQVKNIENFSNNALLSFHEADITNKSSIEPYFQHIDWVFHLAGMADIVPSIEKPEDYFSTNVTGTINVLECSKAAGVKRLVYAASSSSYGIPDEFPTPETSPIRPQYPYALTKYMGEELVLHWAQIYNLPAVSLRLFNVYGPKSRTTGAYGAVFGVFLAQKLNKKPFTVVGDGSQTRDFTYVTDVANAFLMSAKSSVSGEAMNVGSGQRYSVNYLVQLLGGEVLHIPKRPGEPDCTFADTKKIHELLGWFPKVSFEEGVKNMLNVIDLWKDAPIWDRNGIEKATKAWFKYLGK
jgi:UDP-glucose 4-epimerase